MAFAAQNPREERECRRGSTQGHVVQGGTGAFSLWVYQEGWSPSEKMQRPIKSDSMGRAALGVPGE